MGGKEGARRLKKKKTKKLKSASSLQGAWYCNENGWK
jgi:hypothetical protein